MTRCRRRSLPNSAALGEVSAANVQDQGQQGGVLIALDPVAYQRVVDGTPAAVKLPKSSEKLPPIPLLVPALVSAGVPGGGNFLRTEPGSRSRCSRTGRARRSRACRAGRRSRSSSINAVKKAGGVVEPNRVYLRGASAGEVRRAVKAPAPMRRSPRARLLSTRSVPRRSRRAFAEAFAPPSCSPPSSPRSRSP